VTTSFTKKKPVSISTSNGETIPFASASLQYEILHRCPCYGRSMHCSFLAPVKARMTRISVLNRGKTLAARALQKGQREVKRGMPDKDQIPVDFQSLDDSLKNHTLPSPLQILNLPAHRISYGPGRG
jgi:hypothetical protein